MRMKRITKLPENQLLKGTEICYYSKEESRLLIGKVQRKAEKEAYLVKCNYRKDKVELVSRVNMNTKETLLRVSELAKISQGTFYMSHRISVDQMISKGKAAGIETFEVPRELKADTKDTIEIKKIKNKKIKKLKNEYKRRIDERGYRDRQKTWNKFRDKNRNSYFGKSKMTAKEGSKKVKPTYSNFGGGIHLKNNRLFKEGDY